LKELNIKTKRVLEICGIGTGGIETLVMSIIKDLRKDNFEFEVYTNEPNDLSNKKKLEEMGICINLISENQKKINIRYMHNLYKQLKSKEYSVVHSHNLFASGVNLFVAKLAGVPVRIAHAHNTKARAKRTFSRKFYESVMKILIKMFATDLVAVSEEAAVFVFGKKSLKDKRLQIIFNGIDLNKFNKGKYSSQDIYEELGLNKDDIHFVSVARFALQKNQKFLINVFSKVLQQLPNSHLTFVGDGELKADVEKYVNEKGISNKVTFLGTRKDIPNILSAMNYFILPSLWEGFGIVYVEAQAMGLHCFASDCIPKVADAGNISFIPLENSPSQWANEILKEYNESKNKKLRNINMEQFDIKLMEKKISAIYGKN
jgi:glycosyltransferase involved in cell wall biosynthesis